MADWLKKEKVALTESVIFWAAMMGREAKVRTSAKAFIRIVGDWSTADVTWICNRWIDQAYKKYSIIIISLVKNTDFEKEKNLN